MLGLYASGNGRLPAEFGEDIMSKLCTGGKPNWGGVCCAICAVRADGCCGCKEDKPPTNPPSAFSNTLLASGLPRYLSSK